MKQTSNISATSPRITEIEALFDRIGDACCIDAADAIELRDAVRDLLEMVREAADENDITLQRALGMADHYMQILSDGSLGTLHLGPQDLIGCVPPYSPLPFDIRDTDIPFWRQNTNQPVTHCHTRSNTP